MAQLGPISKIGIVLSVFVAVSHLFLCWLERNTH